VPIRLDERTSGEYSQHGEEGVIAAVFEAIGVTSHTCVEFGAYDLKQSSNVYSLWTKGWRALLIESDRGRFAALRAQYAAHPLSGQRRVELVNRLVAETGPNRLDRILSDHGFPVDFDLLCIDVDGLDFQIWRGLRRFRPRLVVIEYNPTIPPHIEIVGAGTGNHIGSSALAVARLGREKGYSLVACIGWNAFFVEREHAALFVAADDLPALFDDSHIRYAMQSYNGEVFFSAPLLIPYWPLFRRDSDAIESSSAPLGRMRNTVPGVAEVALRHHLRPLKLWWRHVRTSWELKQQAHTGRAATPTARRATLRRARRSSRRPLATPPLEARVGDAQAEPRRRRRYARRFPAIRWCRLLKP
jgi:hypothetical protein